MKLTAFINLVAKSVERLKNDIQFNAEEKVKFAQTKINNFLSVQQNVFKFNHPADCWFYHIKYFTDECISTKKIRPNMNFDFSFSYWVHGKEKDKAEKIDLKIQNGNLLHLAAIFASEYMINALVKMGADITKKDSLGRTPFDLLIYNKNYINEQEFEKIKNKLRIKSPGLKLT